MEKLFWGMVGGCTVAFAILLGMYLNKTGVIGAEPESSTEIVSELETETETITGTEEMTLAVNGEFPADIQSIIEDSQKNYSQAMQVFEEESAEASKPQGTTNSSGTASNSGTTSSTNTPSAGSSGSNPKTNGSVDGNRNDNHEYFLENPSEEVTETEESSEEESSTEEYKTEEKKNSEYEYTLYKDHVAIKKYVGTASTLDILIRLTASL